MKSLNKVLSFIIGKPIGNKQQVPAHQLSAHKRSLRRQMFLRREAQVGATLLGHIPAGHHREFFCLDRYTWVWSEQWFDEKMQTNQHMTVRYEFQPTAILKVVNGVPRGYVEGKELRNLHEAIKAYGTKVATEVYSRAPIAV